MTDEKEAPIRLAGLADLFLVQDRPIVRPVDDSVAQVICGHEQILRRGRGHAPAPIASAGMPGGILALGAHLKTMIALTRPGEIVVSQHIGDLETTAARTVHASVAAELEWAAEDGAGSGCYPFPIGDDTRTGALILDRKPTLEAALADLRAGATPGRVSAALHRGLAAAIAAVAQRIGEHRVVLTGGCFQNARLTEEAVAALRQAGCEPLWHRRVPPNDGGIALGQAAWTAWCEAWGDRTCAPRCPRGS